MITELELKKIRQKIIEQDSKPENRDLYEALGLHKRSKLLREMCENYSIASKGDGTFSFTTLNRAHLAYLGLYRHSVAYFGGIDYRNFYMNQAKYAEMEKLYLASSDQIGPKELFDQIYRKSGQRLTLRGMESLISRNHIRVAREEGFADMLLAYSQPMIAIPDSNGFVERKKPLEIHGFMGYVSKTILMGAFEELSTNPFKRLCQILGINNRITNWDEVNSKLDNFAFGQRQLVGDSGLIEDAILSTYGMSRGLSGLGLQESFKGPYVMRGTSDLVTSYTPPQGKTLEKLGIDDFTGQTGLPLVEDTLFWGSLNNKI